MTASDLQTNLFPDVGTVEMPVIATVMDLRHTHELGVVSMRQVGRHHFRVCRMSPSTYMSPYITYCLVL